MKFDKKLIIILFFLFLIISVIGCFEETRIDMSDKIEIVYQEMINETEYITLKEVKGVIKNIGNETYNRVVVEVNFFDEFDRYLKTKTDYVYNLKVNMTDDFSVTYQDYERHYNDIDHYEIIIDIK